MAEEMEGLYDDLGFGEKTNEDNDQGIDLGFGELSDPDELENTEDENEDFKDSEFFTEGSLDEGDDVEEGEGEDNQEPLIETTIINDLLKAKGITNPTAIKYENEEGDIEEYDFYQLPYEDQLQILQHQEESGPVLSDHESEVVNFLRTQNATLDDIITYVKREAIEEYERESSGKSFVVDDYTDEELYMMDLKLNFDDLTPEDVQIQLEKELEHEELFKKKITKIRSQYVDLEIKEREQTENTVKQKEEETFQQLSETLIEAAISLDDIGGITLEDDDKNIIISTVLEKDLNGKADFYKKLEDPANLFKAAWFVEKGAEAFNMIHDYYKKEIDNIRKSAYEKGKTEALKGTSTSTPKMNYRRPISEVGKNNGKKFTNIDDLS